MAPRMSFQHLIQICQPMDLVDLRIDHLEKNRLVCLSIIQHLIVQIAVPTQVADKRHHIDQEWTHQMKIVICHRHLAHHPGDI